jgi:PKD repeat protein
MKKISTLFLAALSVLTLGTSAFAQKANPTSPRPVRCYSDEHKAQEIAANPAAAINYQMAESQIQNWMATHPNNYTVKTSNGQPPIITIPVVVHIIYKTTAQNISNTQVYTQLARLNADYRKNNSDSNSVRNTFKSIAGDAQIEFCLAVRDPSNQPTTGILRKQTTVSSFSTNDAVKYTAQGGEDAWNTSKYLNLWVCNLSGGVLGYAQFPGGTAATDGVVITYSAFGDGGTAASPYDKGRTATHEVGHWLNLYHTFQGGCTGMSAANCASQGDMCCDTPPVSSANFGCPASTVNTCAETYLGNRVDNWENYMDYTDDACMYMFSNDQIARMQACINTSRSGLLTSQGCLPLGPVPVAGITASAQTICQGQTVTFSDATTVATPTTYSWNFGTGATPATATTAGPHAVTFNSAGSIIVTYTVSNSNGTSTKKDTITVNAGPIANISGSATPCANTTAAYSIANSANATFTWTANGGNIVSGQGTNAVTVAWGANGSNGNLIVTASGSGCSSTDTINITASTPKPNITGNATACTSGSSNYSITPVTGSTYAWTASNGTINSGSTASTCNASFTAAGSASVMIAQTYYAGCIGKDTITVNVNAAPSPTISGSGDVCVGNMTPYNVTAVNGSTYNWVSGGANSTINNGQGTNTINVTFNTAGLSTLQVAQTVAGCSGNSPMLTVNVHALPTPSFTFTNNGNAYSFTNTTTGTGTYNWNFGDGGSDQTANPKHNYAAPGTYTVTLSFTDQYGCSGTYSQDVVITEFLGITTLNNASISIQPNPANELTYLSIGNINLNQVQITLNDILGRKVLDVYSGALKNNAVIPVHMNTLADGVYLIKLETKNETIVKRIIKN